MNINEAIERLNNKEIVYILRLNKECYFKIINKKVIVIDINCKYELSITDFIDLFKKEEFFVKEEITLDDMLKKDDEYYSFKHK